MSDQSDKGDPKPKGRAKGGIARKEKLSPERRSEIARNAAIAKHGLKATHKGNFNEEFGLDIECYVLNDQAKSAAISLRGLGAALGFSDGGGGRLTRFLSGAKVAPYVGLDIRQKLENPIIFQSLSNGSAKTYGYDVTVLTDLCRLIIRAAAESALNPRRHGEVIKQANIILGASANAGIKGLVYALAGYRPETEEVIQAFKAFVQEEARRYECEFPTELYLEWARLYGHRPQRSWKDMHLTINHVYYPLAKSDGKLLSLLRDAKGSSGDRNAKLFQFLTLVGTRALRFHLGRIFDVAQNSATSDIYEQEVAKRFGGQQMLGFASE